MPLPLTPIRIKALGYVPTLDGLCEDDEAYQKLIDPNDDPAREALVAKESGCGLSAAGEMRALFQLPEPPPYVNSSAFIVVASYAKPTAASPVDAAHRPTADVLPQAADWLEYGASASAVAHIEFVKSIVQNDDGTVTLVAIAGGERTGSDRPPAGRETIAEVTRHFVLVDGVWRDKANDRPMLVIYDCDDLAIKWGAR